VTDLSRVQYPARQVWSIRRASPRESPLEFLETLADRGDFVPFLLGRHPAVLLNRPDYVSTVLVGEAAKFQKGSANRRARHLLGNGLLTADTDLHAQRRKLIQPAFARPRLDGCACLIVTRARAMCDEWRTGQIVDVTDAIGALTLGLVCEVIAGCSVDGEFGKVKEAVSQATASLDPLVSLVAPLRHVRRARARLRHIVEGLASRASEQASEGSLLSLLDAHDSTQPSAEQRIDDLLTILLAGHETITSALTWALALLALHPEIERRMHEELHAVLSERDATASDIANLVFTRAVLAEALRLYPPAWVLARHAAVSHQFEEGEVQAGSIVLVSQYLLHRDRRFFDRPRSFDPDRWLGAAGPAHPRFAYFPFGAGGRSCIGESFGWMEGVLLLATIGQRSRLRPIGEAFPAVEARITLRPRGPVLMRCER